MYETWNYRRLTRINGNGLMSALVRITLSAGDKSPRLSLATSERYAL